MNIYAAHLLILFMTDYLIIRVTARDLCDFGNNTGCSIWNYSSTLISARSTTELLQLGDPVKVNQLAKDSTANHILLAECRSSSSHLPILESIWFPQSSPGCYITFDLILFDRKSLVSLEVIMQVPPARDRVLWLSSNEQSLHEDQLYFHQSVFIGQISSNFRIIFETTCMAGTEHNSTPVIGLDNVRFEKCFSGGIHNNRCSSESSEFLCSPLLKCLDSDVLCDLTDDCPDGSDELEVCDSFPAGSRCDFEDGYCSWFILSNGSQSQLDWSRVRADVIPKSQELPGDHSSGLQTGHVMLLVIRNGPKPNIVSNFRSPVFNRIKGNGSCKVRFYYWITAQSDANVLLKINTLATNDHGTELWRLRQRTTSKDRRRNWKRASVPVPLVEYPFFLQFSALSGSRNGYVALDDISFSPGCFSTESTDNRSTDPVRHLGFETNFAVTTCGKEGPNGPIAADCDPVYRKSISVENNGLQSWEVPVTALYNITAYGASGGGHFAGNTRGRCPGFVMSGVFQLTRKTILRFLVGQTGESACQKSNLTTVSNCSFPAGSGGRTVVFKTEDNTFSPSEDLILLANGGRGYSENANDSCDTRTSVFDLSEYMKTLVPSKKSADFFDPCHLCEEYTTRKNSSRMDGFGMGSSRCAKSTTKICGNISGNIAIKADVAISSTFWIGNYISGLVTVRIICECPVSCILDKYGKGYYCPLENQLIQPDNGVLNDIDGKTLQYYIAGTFFIAAIVGISVCLYLGLRFRSTKCVQERGQFVSCSTDSAAGRYENGSNSKLSRAESFEMNQLYEIHGVRKLEDLPEIPRKAIELKKPIGQGAFGVVYEGCLRLATGSITVAVKTLPYLALPAAEEEFAAEALVASRFYHPNIVKFFGVCFRNSPKFLVLEMLTGGDVRTFLRSRRTAATIPPAITMLELLEISADIAKGCQYMEQHHFIHRDIAARNCLLTSINRNRVAKIADFGMARDVIKTDYYRKNAAVLIPVKWMAPEAIQNGIYSSKSDIWSFGVFLWEVFSLGCSPFAEQTNDQVIDYVSNGGRLNMPSEHCPPEVFELMKGCWNSSPSSRLGFSTIINVLLSMMGLSKIVSAKVPDDTDFPIPLDKIMPTGNGIDLKEHSAEKIEKEDVNVDSYSQLLPSVDRQEC